MSNKQLIKIYYFLNTKGEKDLRVLQDEDCHTIFLHLLARKYESLLRWWNSFLLFYTFLNSLNFISWLNINFNLQ